MSAWNCKEAITLFSILCHQKQQKIDIPSMYKKPYHEIQPTQQPSID
jgi:hypothetical protein